MSRLIPYTLILAGLLFLGHAAYDEHRGIAAASSPGRSAYHVTARRDQNPKEFRDLMTYEWIRGGLVLCGGWIVLGFFRRADRLDPFSPNFAGNADLDDLNKTLTKEEERRKRLLP